MGLLRAEAHTKSQCSVDFIAEDLQTSTGINVITKTVWRELHGMGVHGQAAPCKPHITKFAKHQMELVKHATTGLWSSGNPGLQTNIRDQWHQRH